MFLGPRTLVTPYFKLRLSPKIKARQIFKTFSRLRGGIWHIFTWTNFQKPSLDVFEGRCSDQFKGLRESKKNWGTWSCWRHSSRDFFSFFIFSLPYLFVFGSVWWIPCGSYRRVSSHETCQWGGAWAPICKYQKTNAEKYGCDTNKYISTNMDKTKQLQTYKRVTANKIGYQKTNVKHSVSLTRWPNGSLSAIFERTPKKKIKVVDSLPDWSRHWIDSCNVFEEKLADIELCLMHTMREKSLLCGKRVSSSLARV